MSSWSRCKCARTCVTSFISQDVEENGKALHMDAGKLRNIQDSAKEEAASDYIPPEETRHQMAVEPKAVAIGPSKIV
jgi:hypothetical protein